jgi:tetratricopeptide (TPR) repeat protein
MLLLFGLFTATFAQEEKSAAEFKNEGNAALKAKDYKTAMAAYESAIDVWDEAEEMDAAMIYNTATCARKLNDNEKSLKYYGQAKELGYKGDISTYYTGLAYKDNDQMEEMENTLLGGIEEFPTSKYLNYMKKELATYYVKQANEYYVEGQKLLNSRVDGNRDQWEAIKGNASVELEKAAELANKAISYQAGNKAAQTIIEKVPELMK